MRLNVTYPGATPENGTEAPVRQEFYGVLSLARTSDPWVESVRTTLHFQSHFNWLRICASHHYRYRERHFETTN